MGAFTAYLVDLSSQLSWYLSSVLATRREMEKGPWLDGATYLQQ